MSISTNIKRLRKSNNITQQQLADIAGVTDKAVSTWENGSAEPRMGALQRIADYFGIAKSSLIEDPENADANSCKIPVLGQVAAGIPISAVEDILDYEEIPATWKTQGEFFALKIKGDSMEPRMISGDVVIVRQQSTAESGDTVVVLVNGDSATCKRLEKTDSGIMLVSTNIKYPPLFFTPKEVDSLPVTILGKVVELRQKY
ncbi:MAG: helix-turn-helix domain-containing protein [Prevotella sp.]|nr:helix-turn-helix domain-containing protein [Prevotella sp.]